MEYCWKNASLGLMLGWSERSNEKLLKKNFALLNYQQTFVVREMDELVLRFEPWILITNARFSPTNYVPSREHYDGTLELMYINLCQISLVPFTKGFGLWILIKFICSEKATKFCEISILLLTGTTKVRWRFCKILWSSQNI